MDTSRKIEAHVWQSRALGEERTVKVYLPPTMTRIRRIQLFTVMMDWSFLHTGV
ncbi:hypothetical protein [Alicyclobacillus sp. TC]|uniref:hypothetical protein n=1 Tax=Alicyclobacillus sp. TC TaxID=2606450 RepID=UPI001EE447BC|nr:hypothetical protein [Alicyclobacillus sp. TC]